jgi:hypothetical protein
MQHALRVTYAEMQGHDVSNAPQLQVPDLESIPSSRAITLRNLTTGRGVTASGQPTAISVWATHWRWFAAAGVAALLLVVALFVLRGRSADATAASPVPSDSAVTAVSASGPVPPPSAVPPEPKPVRLDDLPAESPGHHASHTDAPRRSVGGAPSPRKASGDPFARRQ